MMKMFDSFVLFSHLGAVICLRSVRKASASFTGVIQSGRLSIDCLMKLGREVVQASCDTYATVTSFKLDDLERVLMTDTGLFTLSPITTVEVWSQTGDWPPL